MHPNGALPWSGASVDVTYHGYSQTPTEQRPSDRIQTKTAPDGTWALSLWMNSEGDFQSYYSFKFPNDRAIRISLPAGTPPEIEFSQLAIASIPPSDPSYPSLIELIDKRLASSGVSFPSGGTRGQVLKVAQESPRVLGWGSEEPLQFSQPTPAAEWLWNHNLGFRPKPQVYNLAYQEIDAEVYHSSSNQLRVRVNPAQPGYILI